MPKRSTSLIVDGKKECLACHELKPVSEFKEMSRPARSGGPYYFPRCLPCHRNQAAQYYRDKRDANPEYMKTVSRKATLKQYGLTPEQYDDMVTSQAGKCAVCGKAPEGNGVSRHHLVVDHDHSSGIVRELLCDFCNRGLGIFRDDPDLLISAAAYLIKHQAGEQ